MNIMMPREVLKPINSASMNVHCREMNKTITIDKENVPNKDTTQQLSKGAIPKVIPIRGILKNMPLNYTNSNIPSSLTSPVISSKNIKEKKHVKLKPDNTYLITQFSIYDEDTKNISETSVQTKIAENKDKTSFKKSRNFFVHQEQIAALCMPEIKSPLAKRALARKSIRESFIEAKETFILRVEKEKIQKELNAIFDKKYSCNDNKTASTCRRIAELKVENVDSDQDNTPYDANNIPPQHEPIKILHKNGNVDSIIRPNAALPTYSLFESTNLLYHEDIMNFFLEKEKSRRQFKSNFRRQNTTLAQRKILVSHLINVIKNHNYSSFIAYQAVRVMDDMLDANKIPIEQLQLIELTSMWVVMKNFLLAYVIPEASKIISFSDGVYTVADLIRCERNIMQALNFEISYPDPFTVLNYSLYSHQNSIFLPKDSAVIYYSGSYMLDLTLFDEQLMSLSPILLGCAAAELALVLNLAFHEAFMDPPYNPWRTAFTKKHFKAEEILKVQQLIVRCIAQSSYRETSEHVVYKKYKRSRYGRVSQILILKVSELVPKKSL